MTITAHSLLRWAALAAIVAFLVGTGLTHQDRAAANFSPADVRIDPVNSNVAVGAQVSVNLMLANFPDPDGLGAYEIALTWNPNVLTFNCPTPICTQNFVNGPLLGSTGRSVSCFPPDRDADNDDVNDPGYAKVGCLTFGGEPPGPTANGLLATLKFDTSCAGSTILAFELVTLSDPLASSKEIPVNISGGNVAVTGGQPCAAGHPVGDANCNNTVNAIDAALILQHDAGLLATLACPDEADVNGSGGANALDALLVLQFDAGLLSHLPP